MRTINESSDEGGVPEESKSNKNNIINQLSGQNRKPQDTDKEKMIES